MKTLYLAGGLFNAGERLHNLYLEKYLKRLGYEVILPQREALKCFESGNTFNTQWVAECCRLSVTNPQNLFIGNIDGGDADSGTCAEFGMTIVTNGKALIYRTDFRTFPEKEIGVNAMLVNGPGVKFIYHPCYFTELKEVESYYESLAQKIHEAIMNIGL